MRDNSEKLRDILEAIERIDRYGILGKEHFEENELVQAWITQNLQVIGEASRALSVDFRARHSDIPWSQIIGMRNILVHNYFEIDVEIVWSVVEQKLPDLKNQVQEILSEMSD